MFARLGTSGIAVLCGFSGLALATNSLLYSRESACAALAAAVPGDVAYPNTTAFFQSSSYWSDQQFEISPQCFVTPRSVKSVSTILKTLTNGNWPFTVKGGGHIPYAGGSNIEDGVTIDMVHLNDIKVSSDRQTVSIGPGNRWINVTEVLDPLGLAVVGGRDKNVGVSGLILGGGISYFSGRYGWACDNVREYEVVLASGRIVRASPREHEDLYWALRGGGSLNFGIVTRFDLVAFDQGKIWQNALSFPGTSNLTVIPYFQNLTISGFPSDLGASGFIGINFNRTSGKYSTDVGLLHDTAPSPLEDTPSVFEPFQEIPAATANLTVTADVSTFLQNFATPYGRRWMWGNVVVSATFSKQFLTEVISIYESRNNALLASEGEDNFIPTALIQPIPSNVISAMQKNGGNPMGLVPSDGPLIMFSFPTTWTDRQNDELVFNSTRTLIADIEAKAKQYNVYNPFIYLNYADAEQEVQKSYGEDNYRRLVRVARKYDPQGKLAQLWKGYFKLQRRAAQ